MHGGHLSLPARPIPVRENMNHGKVGSPMRLIQEESILFKPGQINDSRIGTSGLVIWSGFAKIVPARPDEFPSHKRMPLKGGKNLFRRGPKIDRMKLVRTNMLYPGITAPAIPHRGTYGFRYREQVYTPTAQRRGSFAAINQFSGEPFMKRLVLRGSPDPVGTFKFRLLPDTLSLVVQPNDIGYGCNGKVGLCKIHGNGGWPGRIFFLHNPMDLTGHFGPFIASVLFTDLISKTPHDHRWRISVAPDKGTGIGFPPIGENQVKIVWGLFSLPGIKYLVDYKKTHPVGKFKQSGSRRIMCHPDGIAPHFTQDFQLPFSGSQVKGSAQCTQVVVLVNTLHEYTLAIDD